MIATPAPALYVFEHFRQPFGMLVQEASRFSPLHVCVFSILDSILGLLPKRLNQ